MSPQFLDLYGPGVAGSGGGAVRRPSSACRHVACQGREREPRRPAGKTDKLARCQVRLTDAEHLERLRRRVSSIRLTVRDGLLLRWHNADATTFRIAVVNGFDRDVVDSVADELLDCLHGSRAGLNHDAGRPRGRRHRRRLGRGAARH